MFSLKMQQLFLLFSKPNVTAEQAISAVSTQNFAKYVEKTFCIQGGQENTKSNYLEPLFKQIKSIGD